MRAWVHGCVVVLSYCNVNGDNKTGMRILFGFKCWSVDLVAMLRIGRASDHGGGPAVASEVRSQRCVSSENRGNALIWDGDRFTRAPL